jgi:beta-aspartyl-peptidase (threonine type)
MYKNKSIFAWLYSVISIFIFLAFLSSCQQSNSDTENKKTSSSKMDKAPITLIIHGGAGAIKRGYLTPEQEKDYKIKLTEALEAGYNVLEAGGKSIDAVIKAINVMENSPLFNAGLGAVLTHTGKVSMDASIMQGHDLNAGAVAGVQHVKNPILAARLVMDSSVHVLLSGAGADEYAELNGLQMENNEYFITEKRLRSLKRAMGKDSILLESEEKKHLIDDHKFGTVGCVALDQYGNISAGTSTGGMTNKKFGRIGDSPIIGAGTYADNTSCGVSCTGHGEYFIRLSIARNMADLMAYKKLSIDEAAKEVIQNQLTMWGGTGGLVAVDKTGNYVWEFNTPGMFRGVISEGKEIVVEFYEND